LKDITLEKINEIATKESNQVEILHEHLLSFPNYHNYAQSEDGLISVGIGDGTRATRDKNYGGGFAGLEFENASEINFSIESTTNYRRLDKESFVGFFVDYHTPQGYEYRAAFSVGMMDEKRDQNTPGWGTRRFPDRYYPLGRQKRQTLHLHKYAPREWDGRVIFTTVIQNTGVNTHLKARIESIQ